MNKLRYLSQGFALLILWMGFTLSAFAEEPLDLVKRVTNQVLTELRTHRGELRAHPEQIYNIAERYIVPHVDFTEMGRWIAGRNAWAKASSAQRQAFIQAFKTMLVRTYATSLLEYSDQDIEFAPMKSTGKQRVQIMSYVNQTGRSPIRIDYRLLNEGGKWYLYDMIIEGVSLLKGYQAQFSDLIHREGLDAATDSIKTHHGNP